MKFAASALVVALLSAGASAPVQAFDPAAEHAEQQRTLAAARINNDGTVTVGKLRWMRCSLGQRWDGKTCTGSASKVDWDGAMSLAADVNRKGGFAGAQNWRLPTNRELAALRTCSPGRAVGNGGEGRPVFKNCDGDYGKPTIDTRLFPQFPGHVYWTSSRFGGSAAVAYYVDFETGLIQAFDGFKSKKSAVLLVSDE